MKKKDIIFISIIILLIISLILTIIYFKKNDNKIITGEVLAIGSNYLLIGTSSNEDYVINTNTKDYQVGDELEILITNIKTNKTPFEATAKDITIIESIPKEENNQNNSSNNINNNNNTNTSSNNDNQNNIDESNNSNNNNETNDNNTDTNTDTSIITYFQNLDNQLTTYDNNDETLGQTIKNNFVKCIDFIFYNKEINGKTFNELTNDTKLKILSITLSIDSKIDKKLPGYKDSINNTYQNIKTKLIEKYLETTTDICNNDPNLCITAKEGFADLKTNFGITWDVIKELASNGVSKLKDWYEIWRYK